MSRHTGWHRPILVTFSGLDGSGKTTQIENLLSIIAGLGMRSRLVTFWDDVVVLSRYREHFVHTVYRSEHGIGLPEHPVKRNDKNVRAGYLTMIRHLLYLLDTMHLRSIVWRAMRSDVDVIICDRYIYDELANLPLNNSLTRWFMHIVELLAPQPDLALLLDVDPEDARARKPEYPAEFMHKSRQAYFCLMGIIQTITAVPPLPLAEAKHEVEFLFLQTLQQRKTPEKTSSAAPAA